jgi:FAD/FMN-containing dehydrogenase
LSDLTTSRFSFAEPGTPEYQAAAATYNLDVHLEPPLAATVRSVEEAQAAIAEARARRLGVRVLATGHLSDACAPLGDEVVVKVAFDEPVRVDVERRRATVHAGTIWGEVAELTAPHGLVALHGSSPTVGVIGYLLGGGISFYGRRFGVASNSIVSMQLLTADGVVREVDRDTDPELFDALRGGGGGFGLVVSATVALYPVSRVMTGAIFWPIAAVQPLLAQWCDWASDAPLTASTSFRTLSLPPDPALPPELTAGPVVCVDGAIIDEPPGLPASEVGSGLLDPMRRIAEPLVDTWHLSGPLDVTESHMDPRDPLPYVAEHLLLDALPREGQDALLSVAATEACADLTFVELRQIGGAIAEADPAGGVLNRLAGAYALYALGVHSGDEARDRRLPEQVSLVRDVVAPWDTGLTAPTFAAGWTPHQRSFDAATAERMQAIRARVDPDGVFAGNVVRGARVEGISSPGAA